MQILPPALPPRRDEHQHNQIAPVLPHNAVPFVDQRTAFPNGGPAYGNYVQAIVPPVSYNGSPNQYARIDDLRNTHQLLLQTNANHEARLRALEQNLQATAPENSSIERIEYNDHRSSVFKKGRTTSSSSATEGPKTEAETEEAGDFVPISNNAYGAFIHQAFHEEVVGWNGALVQYGPMVIVSFLVQTCIAYELWRELPKSRDADLICPLHSNLQLAAVGVFLLVTFENIPKMYNALIITLICKEFRKKGTTESKKAPYLKIYRRSCMFIFAVLSEFVAWFSILSVGIIWQLSATSHENLIRTTVAITFVNNVDEFVYSGCVTAERQDKHAEYEYRVGYKGRNSVKEGLETLFDLYYTHFHLVTIVGISCGVIFGVRVSDVGCDPY